MQVLILYLSRYIYLVLMASFIVLVHLLTIHNNGIVVYALLYDPVDHFCLSGDICQGHY